MSYSFNLEAIPSSPSAILPPFQLGTLVERLCRDYRVLLAATLELAKRSFVERTRPDVAAPYTGSLYDAYEDALVELAHRCHADHQLGYMVAMLIDDWQRSHKLRPHLNGFEPTSSLRLWTTLHELWGRPFSSNATPTTTTSGNGVGGLAVSEKDHDATNSKLISERRRNTLLRCILSDEDTPSPPACSANQTAKSMSAAAAAPISSAETVALPDSPPLQATPASSSTASSITYTNNARAHFCVNCGAHTEGWPRAWKRYDPMLQVVWCRTCYTPNIVTRHTLLKHYNVTEEHLDSLPSVYNASRASASMRCYLFEQVFANMPARRRVRVQRRLLYDNTTGKTGTQAQVASSTTATERKRKQTDETCSQPLAKRTSDDNSVELDDDDETLRLDSSSSSSSNDSNSGSDVDMLSVILT